MFAFEKRRLLTLFAIVGLLFLLLYLLRMGFLVFFSGIGATHDVEPEVLLRALYLGAKFDLRLALLCGLPVLILAYVPRIGLFDSRRTHQLLTAHLSVVTFALLFFYAFDFGYYDYLARHIDSTVMRFAGDAAISAEMLWQSYPVLTILLGIAATTIAWTWMMGRVLAYGGVAPRYSSRKAVAVSISICAVLAFGGMFGRLGSQVPLRWSEAFFVDDEVVAAVALNPVLYFYDTFKNREDVPDDALVRAHYDEVAAYLGVGRRDRESLNFIRSYPGRGAGPPPNVIFIMLESLGAARLGIFGNPLKPTPNLDDLASRGLFVPRFFVPVTGTARTVFASITGLPDVSRVETATRNPLVTEQHTIINHLDGYRKFFFTGGSASWANMRALVQHNVPDLELFEEGSYSEPPIDVWGISDLSLFREVDRVLEAIPADQPFFAYVQTAGNHRPFTIPEDREEFELDERDGLEARAAGFTSSAQYNAVRFLDYTVGRFIDMARASGYLDRTIFVLFGDHNNRITTLPHMLPAYERLDLESLLVPFIIYGPAFVEPRRIELTMSLVDVLPTVAGLLGVGYKTAAFGRDVLASDVDPMRWVYVQRDRKSAPRIGVVNRDYLLRMRYDGTEVELHRLAGDRPETDIGHELPELRDRMAHLARGLYETAKYQMYNNPGLVDPAPSIAH